MRQPSRKWALSPRNGKFFISRYSLSAGKQPYSVKFWIRILLILAALIVVCSVKISVFLLDRSKFSTQVRTQPSSVDIAAKIPNFDFPPAQIQNGISLITACRNNHEELRSSLLSWTKQSGLDEIVVVDWGSTPPLQFVIEEVDVSNIHHPPIHVIHLKNVSTWISSHALNFALQAARYSDIIKIGCTHKLEDDFVEHHRIRPNTFYTGGDHLQRISDEKSFEDILLASRRVLIKVGGFDERFQEYGGEQADLIERLSESGMKMVDLNYDKLSPISDLNKEDTDIGDIEAAINLELRKGLPPWKPSALNGTMMGSNISQEQCLTTKSFRHPLVSYSMINATVDVKSLREIVKPKELLLAEETVLYRVLKHEYNIPRCVLNILSLRSLRKLHDSLGTKSSEDSTRHNKVLIIHCVSSLPSRINLLLSGLAISRQTGRRMVVFWERSVQETNDALETILDIPESLIVVDVNGNSVSAKKCGGRSFSYNVALKTAKQTPLIFGNELKTVTYIKTDMPFLSQDVKVLNTRVLASEFKKLTVSSTVLHALQTLKEDGLESSTGIYINSSSTKSNEDNLSIFTSIQRQIIQLNSKLGSRGTRIYVDAEKNFISRMNKERLEIVDNSWLLVKRDNQTDYVNGLTRILALTKTHAFLNYSHDDLSRLVSVLRKG